MAGSSHPLHAAEVALEASVRDAGAVTPQAALPPVPDPERPAALGDSLGARVTRLLRDLSRASAARTAAARVDDGDDSYEVSIAPGGRWRVLSSRVEWWTTSTGQLLSAYVTQAGARPRTLTEEPGWMHPAVGLLRPELLPVWGGPGDRYHPVAVIEGMQGPALIELAPSYGDVVGGFPMEAGGLLYVDPGRLLVASLQLGRRTWTLLECTMVEPRQLDG